MSISIVLPDGKPLALLDGATPLDAATAISPRLAEAVVVAKVDGTVQDLRIPLRDGAKLELLKADSAPGRDTINHSAEHLLATAVLKLYPGAKVTMGPQTHGEEFYYDFDVAGRTLGPADLERIEQEIKKLIDAKVAFQLKLLSKPAALKTFDELGQNNEYKQEILSWIPEPEVSIYQCGDFVDLCRGPHLPHAGFIKAFKLTGTSGVYWRADNTKQSLQRVRGVAFPKKEELDQYLKRQEEAKKRDHRKLGKELELFIVSERYDDHDYREEQGLDLYVGVRADAPLDRQLVDYALSTASATFPGSSIRQTVDFEKLPAATEDDKAPLPVLDVRLRGAATKEARKAFEQKLGERKDADVSVNFEPHYTEELGPGLVMWLPKGGRLRSIIEDQWRKMHFEAGYELVYSPHIAKADLWKVSGHWDFYREGMFSPMSVDGHDYCCKPMNCPFHILMVKSRIRSYREFPMRLAELGTVYRYELPGVMHGLMRVRGFTQDDAHLFCRPDQVEKEIDTVLKFILKMLRTFGFTEFEVNLSTRPAEYVGTLEEWARAEDNLRQVLIRQGLEFSIDEGGGAFYGPKIDIKLVDALQRRWQCSTLQYDFNNPERFTMEYVNSEGAKERPIMLHRALLGSIERFIGVLIEHYAGALPAWLMPEQVRVVTVSDRHNEHAQHVHGALLGKGVRATFAPSSDKLGSKIRDAQLEKIPYVLVIGDREVEQNGASLRLLGGVDKGFVSLPDLEEQLVAGCSVPVVS
jgi:threonyl-tRNA synthetase